MGSGAFLGRGGLGGLVGFCSRGGGQGLASGV